MKKIIVGFMVASSLLTSGDLAKCTEAFIMQDKLRTLHDKTEVTAKKLKAEKSIKENHELKDVQAQKEHYELKVYFLLGLIQKWRDVGKKECMGLFEGEDAHFGYFFKSGQK